MAAFNLDQVLSTLLSSSTVAEMKLSVGPILTTTGASKAAKDRRMAVALGRLHHIAIDGQGQERLSALALAWRLTAISAMKEHRRELVQSQSKIKRPFDAHLDVLSDPDDRNYFADSLRHVTGDWVAPYLANAIIRENIRSTIIRRTLSEAFVEATNTLVEQVTLLGTALPSHNLDQSDAESGRARLFAAVIESLDAANWRAVTEREPGEGFGEEFADFCSRSLLRGPIADRDAAQSAAQSALSFIRTVARLHGTMAANAQSYRFLGPLKRVFGSSDWPQEIEPALDQVARQVASQIVFLLRQGKPDSELRRVFLALQGSMQGKRKLVALAQSEEGLDPRDTRWLETGTMPERLAEREPFEEMSVASIDRDLALSLRDAVMAEKTLEQYREDFQSAIETHIDSLGRSSRDLFGRMIHILRLTQSMARRRRLALRGDIGEKVDFSPAEHDPEPDAVGQRTVILKNKIVERVIDGRSVEIIIKADVGRD